jgi:hypothetical protein
MSSNPMQVWPPIIKANTVSMWIRGRDIFITLLAWLTIGFTLHNFLWLVYDYFADPIFQLTLATPPDWQGMWQRLSQFVYIALGLIIWICILALLRRKIINSTKYIKNLPYSSEIKELEIELGVLPADVEHWHEMKSVQVYVSEDSRSYKIIPSRID